MTKLNRLQLTVVLLAVVLFGCFSNESSAQCCGGYCSAGYRTSYSAARCCNNGGFFGFRLFGGFRACRSVTSCGRGYCSGCATYTAAPACSTCQSGTCGTCNDGTTCANPYYGKQLIEYYSKEMDCAVLENSAPTCSGGNCTARQEVSIDDTQLSEINRVRARYGLRTLSVDVNLQTGAENQTRFMSAYGTLQHGRGGFGGEIIAYNYGVGITTAISQWLNSSAHRALLLNPAFSRVGISALRGHDGRNWCAVRFY